MNHESEQARPTPEDTRPNVVSEALAMRQKADELRGAAIKRLLEDRERIEADLKALGYIQAGVNGNGTKKTTQVQAKTAPDSRRFKGKGLADVGRILLRENGIMHGKEIEAAAKEGGFKSKSNHFQSYLAVAFKRDGGFVNVGGNRWKLEDGITVTVQ